MGNVRYAVTYKPSGDPAERAYAGERTRQIAKEWSEGMRAGTHGEIRDFVCAGDVDIRVIGSDNALLDTEVPVRQLLEQLIAKLSIPPFLLGLNWSTTERMSTQQADILTSELEYYRRLLEPALRRIGTAFLRLPAQTRLPAARRLSRRRFGGVEQHQSAGRDRACTGTALERPGRGNRTTTGSQRCCNWKGVILMMYQNLKLEKGMYHITGKNFSEVLESVDPSASYAETPLAGLDAFERQLKRFDIHVSGPCCDRVEKFFSTTDSAVLFPEFIRRAITAGMEQSILSDIVAVHTKSESGDYLAAAMTDTAAYTVKGAQNTALPGSVYQEETTAIKLTKYGRMIRATYEAIRSQRLDAFTVTLRSVGVRLANSILLQAVDKLESDAGSIVAKAGSALTYSPSCTAHSPTLT